MDKKYEQMLMEEEMRHCARCDNLIMNEAWDINEFDFYSNTSKRIKELTEKYSLSLEEVDELMNIYTDEMSKFRKIKK